jgi:hypothetical protein
MPLGCTCMYVWGLSANKGEIIVKIWSSGAILRRAEVGKNLSWRLAWRSISHMFECKYTATECLSPVPPRKGMDFYRASNNSREWGVLWIGAVCRGCVDWALRHVTPEIYWWVMSWFVSVRCCPQIDNHCTNITVLGSVTSVSVQPFNTTCNSFNPRLEQTTSSMYIFSKNCDVDGKIFEE